MVAVGDAGDDGVDWRKLVQRIRDKKIAIVLGPSVYPAGATDGPTFEESIARTVERTLALPPSTSGLRDVSLSFLGQNGAIDALRSAIVEAIDGATTVPPILAQLAEIGFDLYLTLGYDRLLERALAGAGRASLTASLVGDANDIDTPIVAPTVYHLLGTATDDDVALTDADVIELVHRLRRDERPKRLFDVLTRRTLLFLGCNMPDWLARFFHRALNGESLSRDTRRAHVVVDSTVAGDARLARFLSFFQANVVSTLTPAAFVERLHREWLHDPQPQSAAGPLPPPKIPKDAIFLSYKHDDELVVGEIAKLLVADGMEVFFDRTSIEAATNWRDVLDDALARCLMFVPIITASTQIAGESYFWREWRAAADRAKSTPIKSTEPGFLLPVIIGTVDFNDLRVPDEFPAKQALLLPAGAPTPEFVRDVAKTYRILKEKAKRTG